MRTWIDTAVQSAMNRYLETCIVGGMPAEKAREMERALDHAAGLGMFSLKVAEEMSRQGFRFVREKEAEDGA